LHQFNPSISDVEAERVASELYESTKGQRSKSKAFNNHRSFWRGGTESVVFNKLEAIAEQDVPRTPVLGCAITEALMRRYINKGGFMPSRINWAIQSSGVDYLHLLIVSMEYLIKVYGIDARLSITVHDEIRYLVKDEDVYRAAMALQISNLWTRAMFCQELGINDVPQVRLLLKPKADLACRALHSFPQ
jgi:DNA polymerase gamma 1